MRLIDADAISYREYLGDDEPRVYKSQIDAAPTIDPVKHGRWDDSLDGITPYCTVCGQSHRLMTRTPAYCPSYGAQMDGEV